MTEQQEEVLWFVRKSPLKVFYLLMHRINRETKLNRIDIYRLTFISTCQWASINGKLLSLAFLSTSTARDRCGFKKISNEKFQPSRREQTADRVTLEKMRMQNKTMADHKRGEYEAQIEVRQGGRRSIRFRFMINATRSRSQDQSETALTPLGLPSFS